MNGQGRRVPFPAVDWQTNSKSYAAFTKRHKAASAPFRLTMGLEPLCRDDWIEVSHFMPELDQWLYFLSNAAQRYIRAFASRQLQPLVLMPMFMMSGAAFKKDLEIYIAICMVVKSSC